MCSLGGGLGGIPTLLSYSGVCRSVCGRGGKALQLLAWSGKAHSPAALLGFFHQDLSQLGPKCCDLIFAHKRPLQH